MVGCEVGNVSDAAAASARYRQAAADTSTGSLRGQVSAKGGTRRGRGAASPSGAIRCLSGSTNPARRNIDRHGRGKVGGVKGHLTECASTAAAATR
jgi:hypothetical protein